MGRYCCKSGAGTREGLAAGIGGRTLCLGPAHTHLLHADKRNGQERRGGRSLTDRWDARLRRARATSKYAVYCCDVACTSTLHMQYILDKKASLDFLRYTWGAASHEEPTSENR